MMKILVTGATRNTGMAVIYALTKEGYTVIGTDERRLPFNIHSRHTKSYYIHAPFSDNQFYEDILSIIKIEKPDVLIPIGSTKQISLHKNEISNYVNLLVPDYENFCEVYDKKRTYSLCKEVGVAVPERFTDVEADCLLKNEKNAKLVIKPDFDIGGARGLRFVSNIEELDLAKKNIQNKLGNYVIEEFIPGASRTRTIQLLFDKNNTLSAHFILKKIHQWPITGGNTAYAESTHEWELVEFVMPFFNKCPWEGPVGVQLIIDERDRKPKLIEINPRFTGSLTFAIQCGVNLPYITCLAAVNGQGAVTPPNYDAGMFYINFSYYVKAVMKEFYFTKNKAAFLYEVLHELKKRKINTFPDRKDFLMYITKLFSEVFHN